MKRAAILAMWCAAASGLAAVDASKVAADYGKLPLGFEENQGQLDPAVRYASRGRGLSAALTREGPVLVAGGGLVRMKLQGAEAMPLPSGERELPGRVNVLLGSDPSKWRTGIRAFEQVRYRGVYPGVDLVVHGRQGQLEYDFEVAPGASPEQIRIRFDGARVRLNARGELELTLPGGEKLSQRRPVAFESEGGRPVASRHRLYPDGTVGFTVGRRDPKATLVIDPVLVYSTYLGGGGVEFPVGISVDVLGNAYVTGSTQSTNFPIRNAVQANNQGLQDVFVAKLNDTGTALVYSTYLGGGGDETGRDLAADRTGAVYVTGYTGSNNFPVVSAVQASRSGGLDAFAFKLNPAGNALAYSTYLGGTEEDLANGVAVDAYGNAFITGATRSFNFPVANAFQATNRSISSSVYDSFVAQLSPSGGTLVYSSYLGGADDDVGREIAVDPSGNAYVVGYTRSTDFPVRNAFQDTVAGTPGTDYDAFLAKVNPAGTALVYASYLGGTSYDEADDVTVDPTGVPMVAGYTRSTNFPVVNAFQSVNRGGFSDGFIARVAANGSALSFSSYIGGDGQDGVRGVAVDASGGVSLGGYSGSTNFPLVGEVQGDRGGMNAFVSHLTAAGTLDFSTYLGGDGDDFGRGLAVDGSGNAYSIGQTSSTNFPTTAGSIQLTYGGGSSDAFVAKLGDTTVQVTAINPNQGPTAGGTVVTITGVNFNQGSMVSIGGVFATNVNVISTTTITATTPASAGGATGAVDVTVTRRIGTGGSATLAGGFTYTATPPPPPPAPTVTRITPPSGTTAGGTAFTVTGTNFQPNATITIGGTMATGVSFVSPTTLTGATPAHAAGTVDVVVTNPDSNQSATLSAAYTYVGPPTVTSITPNSAPLAGGTSVVITGTGFADGVAVSVGGLPLLNQSLSGPTRVTGNVAPHPAGIVDVVATNPDGQRGALVNGFTYRGPPTVTGINPPSGPSAGGTRVTISGTGFQPGATVTIDGVAATAIQVDSETQLLATTFEHAPTEGGVDVVVTNPDGQSGTLSRGFTYEPPPGGYAGWPCGCSSGTGAFALLGALGAMALRRRRRSARGAALVAVAVLFAPAIARAAGLPAHHGLAPAWSRGGAVLAQKAPLPAPAPLTTPPPKPASPAGTSAAPGATPPSSAPPAAPAPPSAPASSPPKAPAPSPARSAASSPEPADEPPPTSLVKVTATGFGDVIGRRIGAELGGSAGVMPWMDLGLAATLGPMVGGRLTVNLHTPRPEKGLSPFLQLRGIINPVPQGLGVGGGAWLGGALEAGPGRLVLGVAGEYVAGPPQYLPLGVWLLGGYEFDLMRPDRPASGLALLRGRVMDVDEKPVNAVVTFPGAPPPLGEKKFDASPTFEAKLPPGEHVIEVRAPGYLVRGKSLAVRPGETLVVDFALRPEPAQPMAQLTDTSIEIRQMIQFEFNQARLLKSSYEILDAVTDILLEHKELKIRIEGHTDDVGGAEFNRKLSQARAEAVRNYLVDWGVEPERLVAEGYGLTRPITTNATEAGRAANRRVQFKIINR